MTLYALVEVTEAEGMQNTLKWILERLTLWEVAQDTKFSCQALTRMLRDGHLYPNWEARLRPATESRWDLDFGNDSDEWLINY